MLGLSVDVLRKTYWVYTTFSLYEVLVENEDRDVWKMYLEKKSFEDALMYAKVYIEVLGASINVP